MPAPPGVIAGTDMILNGDTLLTLYRGDPRQSPVQGGRFGQIEAGQQGGSVEHPLVFDRLDGGVGGTERLVPNTYPLAINGCTRFGRTWMPSGKQTRLGAFPNHGSGRPAGRITSMCVQGDDLLIAAGGVLYRLSSPYTTPVPEYAVGVTEYIQDVLEYNGMIVLGTYTLAGTPGRIHVKEGVSWTVNTAMGRHLCQAYFVINNVGAWRLATNDTDTTFRYVVATDAASLADQTTWVSDAGSGLPIGCGTHPVTNIVGAPLVMFFTTTCGLWHIKDDGRSAKIADWDSAIHPDNGRVAYFMFGGVFASHARAGLVRVDVSTLNVEWEEKGCAPGSGYAKVTPLNGPVRAATSDGDFLALGQYNGTDSHISYGRPNEISRRLAMAGLESPQLMNWHGGEISLFNQEVTCTEQASIGPSNRPLMWVGSLEGSTPVLTHVSLPDQGTPIEDLIQGGQHGFNNESWLYLPLQDFGGDDRRAWATSRKIFTRLEVTGKYLERYTSWIDAYMSTSSDYSIFWDRAVEGDADSPWSLVGRLDSANQINMAPPPSVQSGVTAGIMFRGYGTDDHPFVWTGAKLRGVPLLELAERRRYRVVVGRVRRTNRSMSVRDRQAALQELLAYQWADPVKLYDHTGVTLIVQVEEGMSYEEVYDRKMGDWVTVVTFSCRVIRRPFFWGLGYRFGSDVMWS